MQAIVSLLEESAHRQVEAIWNVLELECGLAGIKVTPYPHFSWQVVEDYPLEPLKAFLKQLASGLHPIQVTCTGLGIFTGPEPVIYIPVVKTDKLLRFHHLIWKNTFHLAVGPSPYYAPETWIPHITLAHSDVDSEKLACALKALAAQPLNWDLIIDNLALVSQSGGEVGQLQDRFDLQ